MTLNWAITLTYFRELSCWVNIGLGYYIIILLGYKLNSLLSDYFNSFLE